MRKLIVAALLLLSSFTAARAQGGGIPLIDAGRLLFYLQQQNSVTTVCPTLAGATIGDPTNKATWTVTYSSGASGTCTSATSAAITAFTGFPISMQIVSTGNSTLNGTYSIDQATTQRISSLLQYVQTNGVFPPQANPGIPAGKQGIFDTSGTAHAFGVSEFANFATAMGNFVNYIQQGGIPSQPVTIP